MIDPRGRVARAVGWSGLITFASHRRAPGFVIENRIASQMGDVLSALQFPIVERTSEAPITDRIRRVLEAILRALKLAIHGSGRAFEVMVFPSARMHAGDAGERQDHRKSWASWTVSASPSLRLLQRRRRVLRWQDLYSGIQGHWQASGHQEAAKMLRSLLVTLVGARDTVRLHLGATTTVIDHGRDVGPMNSRGGRGLNS